MEQMMKEVLLELNKLNERFDGQDKRFDRIDKRLDSQDKRFDHIDDRFGRLEEKQDHVLIELFQTC